MKDFAAEYAEALLEHVRATDDDGLTRAWSLGRAWLQRRFGVVELSLVHSRALSAFTEAVDPARASQFLTTALSPFEMALRGFDDANRALLEAAATLERRVDERTSELRAIEKTLREKSGLLNSVVESMSDGLVVADLAGTVLLVNGSGLRLLGPEVWRLPPRQWAEACGLYRPDGSSRFEENAAPLVLALEGRLEGPGEMLIRNPLVPQGVHVSVHGSLLRDERGEVTGGLALFRDVSETRRANDALVRTEEQLRHLQKMDALGRLAGGVAHDFNNILTVIISVSELAQLNLSPGDPLLEDLREIHEAGGRAAALTQQLLLFSRQQLSEETVVEVNELLAGMEKMLRRLIGSDIEFTTELGGPGTWIRADAGSLEQVVMNLVVNARDAMPDGGRLSIKTEEVMVDESFARRQLGLAVGKHVLLTVSDTGTGMDPVTASRVFEPFFTTKEKGKGSGLGLSTVFGIVRKSRGAVWLTTAPGRGATFQVYLPVIEHRAVTPAIEQRAVTPMPAGVVLLVEDDEHVRSVAASILQRNGFELLVAADGLEALEVAEAHAGPIDLLLTDVVMPRMGGFELVRRIAPMRPAMKIIVMSGYADDPEARASSLGPGVQALQKPLTPRKLMDKVMAVVRPDADQP